jgi:hypothetical protein
VLAERAAGVAPAGGPPGHGKHHGRGNGPDGGAGLAGNGQGGNGD